MDCSFDLRDHLKIYSNSFPHSLGMDIVQELKESPWEKHKFYHVKENNFTQYEDDFWYKYIQSPNHNKLMEVVYTCIRRYIVDDGQWMHQWFNSWAGYTPIRYNQYTPHTNMKLHCDHIHSIFDGQIKGIPTLTVLGLLPSDFTGGEFVMWGKPLDVKPGDCLVFPSNFLYPHGVMPVKEGVRYSFVSWVY